MILSGQAGSGRRGRVARESPAALIDRTSPLPYYFELAELLEREITGGRRESGFRLPPELELCEQYGVARTTVPRALTRFEKRGLIERLKGQGTFVRQGPPGLWLLGSSDGFFQDEVDRLGMGDVRRSRRSQQNRGLRSCSSFRGRTRGIHRVHVVGRRNAPLRLLPHVAPH